MIVLPQDDHLLTAAEAEQVCEDTLREHESAPETIRRLRAALIAAEVYFIKALIDLDDGTPKRAVATLEFGIRRIRSELLNETADS